MVLVNSAMAFLVSICLSTKERADFEHNGQPRAFSELRIIMFIIQKYLSHGQVATITTADNFNRRHRERHSIYKSFLGAVQQKL